MTKQELFDFHKQCTEKMLEISKKKNSDYTGAGANPFANFEMVEHLGITSTEIGIMTRLSDKMSRLSSLLKKQNEVADESIEDTILDAANYLLILAAFLHDKKKEVN